MILFFMKFYASRILLVIFVELILYLAFINIWGSWIVEPMLFVSSDMFWLLDLVFLAFNLPVVYIFGTIVNELIRQPALLAQIGIKNAIIHELIMLLGLLVLYTLAHIGFFNSFIPVKLLLQHAITMIPLLLFVNYITPLIAENKRFILICFTLAIGLLLTKFNLIMLLPSHKPYSILIYLTFSIVILLMQNYLYQKIDLHERVY